MFRNFTFCALFLLCCDPVDGARWAPIKPQLKEEKTKRAWKSCFTPITGHQLVFLSDCKDVVVSCVIIEPTYNHEREGRGNFVQEGKSGELASPPWLSHPTDSGVGGRLSFSPAALKTVHHVPLSYSPLQQLRSLCHLVVIVNVAAYSAF